MSLPRFLRGFQKKSPASNSDNGPPLSRRNSSSSSSSNSSEPTDAFGFPLPATTVITTIQLHPATPTSPVSPPLYLGPMNNLFEENSVTSPLISSDPVLGIENERMDNNSSSSSKDSCNSGHQLNHLLDPHINEKHSRPSSPSSFHSSIYPTPQKEESVLDSACLSTSAPSTSLHLSVSDSIPAPVQAVSRTLPDEPSKPSTIKTIGFDIILTVTEVNEDGELEENLLVDTATGANIEGSVGGSNTRPTKHDLVVVNDGEQQQLQGSHNSDESDQPVASDAEAVPAIPNEGVTTMDQDQPVVALTVPLLVTSIESADLKPDTNSIIHPLNSIQEHDSSRRHTLESKRRSRSLSTPTRSRSFSSPNNNATRPVSILKSGSPKLILRSRSRSGSQPMTSVLVEESDSHDSLIPAFPSPPSTTSSQRLSVCSSSSLASRTSLYLHQDSMAETNVRRAGSQSRRRSSIRDVQSVQS
ncbi:hypothetical protein BGX21_011547, partial [Mortierella sp. AD011]